MKYNVLGRNLHQEYVLFSSLVFQGKLCGYVSINQQHFGTTHCHIIIVIIFPSIQFGNEHIQRA